MLRTSCILTLTPLRRNLSWRKRSTCNRPIISTIRLRDVPLSFNQPCIATIHGCGIHVSGGVLLPQLACELSIFRFGSVTQYGIDVGAKRVSIRRRRHERVVEVHVHLAEERMEPVIHRCHRCIGGEVGADSSNHLSSDEQVRVCKIEVGISCSRYHEFYWTPRVERCQRLVFNPATVFYTRLASVARRKCLVHSSLHHMIVGVRTPYYENTSVRCRRLVGVTRRRVAVRCIRFTRLPGGGGVLRRLCIRMLPAAAALRFAAFLTFLPANDIASNLRSSRQRTLPQSDSTSFAQRGNRSEENTEQTSKPGPLWTRAPVK